MPPDADLHRDIGRLEAQVASLNKTVESLDEKVDAIKETLAQAAGGWRTLMWVAGASSAVGGLVAYFFPFLAGPRP